MKNKRYILFLGLLMLSLLLVSCGKKSPTEVNPDREVIIKESASGPTTMVLPGTATLGPTSGPQIQKSSSTASLAGLIVGGNYGGLDLIPSNGDVLSGTFTNVGTFQIQPGVMVFVDPGVDLSISANNILIEGTLDGSGAGFAGGVTPPVLAQPGQPGQGPGGGGGGNYGPFVHGPGGGGGGYGGAGGQGGRTLSEPPAAPGGPSYGNASPPTVQKGSGGGSAAAHGQLAPPNVGGPGGAGGAAISLIAATITVNGGSIVASGANGQSGTDGVFPGLAEGGGGGGSGGSIWLDGGLALFSATLSANGGSGGDVLGIRGFGTGGGGGGGGRIKLSGCLDPTSSFAVNVNGAAPGSSVGSQIVTTNPSPGAAGTFVDSTTGPCIIEVELDIIPHSCPNFLDIQSNGVIPVTIVGTANLDVSTINPESVRLEGIAPIGGRDRKDVTTPVVDRQDVCDCTTGGPDDITDLSFRFSILDLRVALADLEPVDEVEVVLTLTGVLRDGTAFEGKDCVVILNR